MAYMESYLHSQNHCKASQMLAPPILLKSAFSVQIQSVDESFITEQNQAAMAIQVAVLFVVVTLIVDHTSAQSCGTFQCSQVYSSSCPAADKSSELYDGCMTSQSDCNQAIGTPQIQ